MNDFFVKDQRDYSENLASIIDNERKTAPLEDLHMYFNALTERQYRIHRRGVGNF